MEGGRARLLRSGDKEIEFLDPAFTETEHASPSRRHFRPAIAGEVEKLENFTAQGKEIRAAAIARTIKCDRNDLLDRARPLRQDDDAIAHVNGFVDVVSNEEHCSAPVLPKAQEFILHTHAGERVEGAERLIQQKNFGMINQGASQSYALRHSARKVMRISVGESFQANKAHKFSHFIAFLLEHATGSEPRLNITTHRQPRKKIGILKDKASFSAGARDWLLVYEQLT